VERPEQADLDPLDEDQLQLVLRGPVVERIPDLRGVGVIVRVVAVLAERPRIRREQNPGVGVESGQHTALVEVGHGTGRAVDLLVGKHIKRTVDVQPWLLGPPRRGRPQQESPGDHHTGERPQYTHARQPLTPTTTTHRHSTNSSGSVWGTYPQPHQLSTFHTRRKRDHADPRHDRPMHNAPTPPPEKSARPARAGRPADSPSRRQSSPVPTSSADRRRRGTTPTRQASWPSRHIRDRLRTPP
jgi:hypothetical protein